MSADTTGLEHTVMRLAELPEGALADFLTARGMQLHWVADGAAIPGSFWGDCEAGLIGNGLYVRADTPVHSAMHESCHYLCASPERQATMHTNAGGTQAEENAVCFLQILLAERLQGFDVPRMWRDMDAWGYNFRLGSARRWFYEDAEDAREWLLAQGLYPDGADQLIDAHRHF